MGFRRRASLPLSAAGRDPLAASMIPTAGSIDPSREEDTGVLFDNLYNRRPRAASVRRKGVVQAVPCLPQCVAATHGRPHPSRGGAHRRFPQRQERTLALKTAPPASNESEAVLPFLKWAGGKRWLAKRYGDLFDVDYERYLEPFLGGASMFFALRPSKSILADCNSRLIEAYVAIRDEPEKIAAALGRYQESHSDDFYYSERKRQYPDSATQRAAQLIYLNRTCWNGLYRVNRRGEFNVPRGTKTSVVLDSDDFGAVSEVLEHAELLAQDFEQTLGQAGNGDLVYVDPPYTANHNQTDSANTTKRCSLGRPDPT